MAEPRTIVAALERLRDRPLDVATADTRAVVDRITRRAKPLAVAAFSSSI